MTLLQKIHFFLISLAGLACVYFLYLIVVMPKVDKLSYLLFMGIPNFYIGIRYLLISIKRWQNKAFKQKSVLPKLLPSATDTH